MMRICLNLQKILCLGWLIMARNRMIKPEFWSSEDILGLSIEARLFFIGLWSFADDSGVLPKKALTLKCQIFPVDNVDVKLILTELLNIGLLVEYSVQGNVYIQIKSWIKHQTIQHPTYRYPLKCGTIPIYGRHKKRTGTDDVQYNNSTGTDGVLPKEKEKEKEKENKKENKNTLSNPTDKTIKKITKASDDLEFMAFYNRYNHKKGKNQAFKAWKKLNKADKIEAFEKVEHYFSTIKEGISKVHPSTYLNQQRWTDELSHDMTKPRLSTGVNNLKDILQDTQMQNLEIYNEPQTLALGNNYDYR